MFRRRLLPKLEDALGRAPVVFLQGARQTGKSTLAQAVRGAVGPPRYLTLDDPTTLARAESDPANFVAGLDGPVVLDEVQRAPALFLAIKASVDRDRRPGRFLLTGSANLLLLPRLSDALVGRMEVLTLWPLAQEEIEGTEAGGLDALFRPGPMPSVEGSSAVDDVFERMFRGGYPEPVGRRAGPDRDAWFGSYVDTLFQRDVRDLAQIEGFGELSRLLSLLAARMGGLLNAAELSRSVQMPLTTLRRYLALLQGTFLYAPLPAWSVNFGKRLVRAPKVALSDTGLAAHLLGIDHSRLVEEPTVAGPMLENFVLMELRKQAGWSRTQPRIFHLRSQAGDEVDVVLEDRAGAVVGVEVKASASLSERDAKGLLELARAAALRFVRGLFLYRGPSVVPIAQNIHAVPLSWLWRARA